jgi:hypothetical protein
MLRTVAGLEDRFGHGERGDIAWVVVCLGQAQGD